MSDDDHSKQLKIDSDDDAVLSKREPSAEEIVAAAEKKEDEEAAKQQQDAASSSASDEAPTTQRLVCCNFLLGKCPKKISDECNFAHADTDATPCNLSSSCPHGHESRKWEASDATAVCRCCNVTKFGTILDRVCFCRRCGGCTCSGCLSLVGEGPLAIKICRRCWFKGLVDGTSPRTPPTRGWFSWVPTDAEQLKVAELMMTAPLFRVGFQQYNLAGLNTFSLRAFSTARNMDPEQSPLRKDVVQGNVDFNNSVAALSASPQLAQQRQNAAPASKTWSCCGGSSSSGSSNKNSTVPSPPVSSSPPSPPPAPAAATIDVQEGSKKGEATQKQQIRVRLQHVVLTHGFAGGAALFLPNLRDLADKLSKINGNRLAAAMQSINSHDRQNASASHKKGQPRRGGKASGNRQSGAAAAATVATASSRKKRDFDDDDDDAEVVEADLELFILHAFDLPGFARSARDSIVIEETGLAGCDAVIAHVTRIFDAWFALNELGNVERWVDVSCLKEEQLSKFEFVSAAASQERAEKVSSENTTASSATADFSSTASSVATTSGYRVHLAAHSFGAWCSAHYARQRPNLISHLILIDPFGVPVYNPHLKEHTVESLPWKWQMAASFLKESLVTRPLRALGPWAPSALQKWRPDFLCRFQPFLADAMCVFDYIFHCNTATPCTGDYLFTKVVQGRAYGRRPLSEFVPYVSAEQVAAAAKEIAAQLRRDAVKAAAAEAEFTAAAGQDPAKAAVEAAAAMEKAIDEAQKKEEQSALAEPASTTTTTTSSTASSAPLLPKSGVTPPLPACVRLSMCYGVRSWMNTHAGSNMFDDRARALEELRRMRRGAATTTVDAAAARMKIAKPGVFALIEGASHQVATDQPEKFDLFLLRAIGVVDELSE